MDTWVVSFLGYCEKYWVYEYVFKPPPSIILGMYPEVELDHKEFHIEFFETLPHQFQEAAAFYIPTSEAKGFQFFFMFTNTYFLFFW